MLPTNCVAFDISISLFHRHFNFSCCDTKVYDPSRNLHSQSGGYVYLPRRGCLLRGAAESESSSVLLVLGSVLLVAGPKSATLAQEPELPPHFDCHVTLSTVARVLVDQVVPGFWLVSNTRYSRRNIVNVVRL